MTPNKYLEKLAASPGIGDTIRNAFGSEFKTLAAKSSKLESLHSNRLKNITYLKGLGGTSNEAHVSKNIRQAKVLEDKLAFNNYQKDGAELRMLKARGQVGKAALVGGTALAGAAYIKSKLPKEQTYDY